MKTLDLAGFVRKSRSPAPERDDRGRRQCRGGRMGEQSAARRGVLVDSPTEERNPRTLDLDTVATLDLLTLINGEDQRVPLAVAAVLPQLALLVDAATERVRAGGTVHYVGAGTSGRLGVIDAAELLEVTARDVVIGSTAAGRTPYGAGALRSARAAGHRPRRGCGPRR